jgi:hypothetical protein
VYRATTPAPEHVRKRLVLRIAPEPAEFYYEYGVRHPYYWVRDLLTTKMIDVVVEFREAGPSGSKWDSEEAIAALGRFEYASRWEIEPPTERQRQMHDLVVQLSETVSDEKRGALLAQLQALGQQEDAEQAGASQESPASTDQQTPLTLAEWTAQYATAHGSTVEEVTQAALDEYARRHGYARPPRGGRRRRQAPELPRADG